MEDNIEYRQAKPSDIEQAVAFHNRTYNDSRTLETWRWEYESEFPDKYVFTVASDGDKVIATQGMLPIITVLKGEKLLCSKSESSLMDPAYRGKTIFQDLYQFAMDQCAEKKMYCVYGMTTAVKVWEKKLGFHVYTDAMFQLTRPICCTAAVGDVLRSKRNLFKKTAKAVLTVFQSMGASMKNGNLKAKKGNYEIKEKLADLSDMDKLYQRLREKHPNLVHLNLDEKYIRWRIDNNPFVTYKTYYIYQNGELTAYCFFNSQDKTTVHLADFTYENEDAGLFLLNRIMKEARKDKLAYMSYVGNLKNEMMRQTIDLLMRGGFTSREFMPFVLKNVAFDDDNYLYDIANWYINGLWTEGTSI